MEYENGIVNPAPYDDTRHYQAIAQFKERGYFGFNALTNFCLIYTERGDLEAIPLYAFDDDMLYFLTDVVKDSFLIVGFNFGDIDISHIPVFKNALMPLEFSLMNEALRLNVCIDLIRSIPIRQYREAGTVFICAE